MTDFTQGVDFPGCGGANYCSGNTTLGDTVSQRQASEGGTPDTTNITFGVVASASDHDTVFFEIIDGTNNLEDLDGATGDWTINLNIVSANMNLRWDEVAVCRLNSSCVNQETIGTNFGGGIIIGTTGVKAKTAAQASVITMGATDVIMVIGSITNLDEMMTQTAAFDPDQDISNQWAVSGAGAPRQFDHLAMGHQ